MRPDDCLWNLSDGVVELTLTKAEGMHWWARVVEGDPSIDTQAVEPESSRLEDLDPETRTTVEKMMVRDLRAGCMIRVGGGVVVVGRGVCALLLQFVLCSCCAAI